MKVFKTFEAYTDGACSKIGVGGAGLFMFSNNTIIDLITLKQDKSSNNQMELTGVILALRSFELESNNTPAQLTVYTDSQYVQKGITEWIHNWKKKNWKSSSNTDVINKELWILLDNLRNRLVEFGHRVNIEWVRGHNGNIGNEIADFLATNVKFNTMAGYEKRYNPDNKITIAVNNLISKAECDISKLDATDVESSLFWEIDEETTLIESLNTLLEINFK